VELPNGAEVLSLSGSPLTEELLLLFEQGLQLLLLSFSLVQVSLPLGQNCRTLLLVLLSKFEPNILEIGCG